MNTILNNIDDIKRVKDDIKVAIEEKGVDMTNTPFSGYAAKISEITIGSGDYETGFENGVAAQKAKLSNITITNNGTYSNEDGYGEVIVNVYPKISLKDTGLKIGFSRFTEVPEWLDFEGIVDMNYMFGYNKISTIPFIDTSKVIFMEGLFYDCQNLIEIPLLNTSKVTSMRYMFYHCISLTTIPAIITSNVTDMANMFADCSNLQTLPELDTSNVLFMDRMFSQYRGIQTLTSLPKFNVPNLKTISSYFYYDQVTMNNLTDVGGWIGLKINWNDNGGLVCLPNLTYQSCINILNGLADVTELGSRTLKVHQNFIDLVGDEISIGTNKGWIISAS